MAFLIWTIKLKTQYEYYVNESFSVQKLMGIFDYFEAVCWKDIEKKVKFQIILKIMVVKK